MHSIVWPKDYVPGYTDNFVSNEMIIKDLSLEVVWENLVNTAAWTKYYSNMADVEFYEQEGTHLKENTRFKFKTFGFPIEAQITEFVPPFDGEPGRIAWHGWNEVENPNERLDVIHAWLIEELAGNRVRILTQETQNGKPAVDLAKTRPNRMLNGHQAWLDGLISYSLNS
ncbi:SRPBCC domain-containing protein [Aliarcobacter butzleri]